PVISQVYPKLYPVKNGGQKSARRWDEPGRHLLHQETPPWPASRNAAPSTTSSSTSATNNVASAPKPRATKSPRKSSGNSSRPRREKREQDFRPRRQFPTCSRRTSLTSEEAKRPSPHRPTFTIFAMRSAPCVTR